MTMSFPRNAAFALLLGTALAGCAQVDYQPYEGRDATVEGRGGTRRMAAGIDVWSNGAPPRRYRVLGVASVELGEGIGHQTMVDSALASQVRKAGGDAAILLASERSVLGIAPVGTMFVPLQQRFSRFQVIRYLD